jgi:DNA-binding CsgD family transcriptional regulator/PAS domain-containing protein
MAFQSRSVVEFGLLFSRMSESLIGGGPLHQPLDLVRSHLGATAVALKVEDRASGNGAAFVAEDGCDIDEEPSLALVRLGVLLDRHRCVQASAVDETESHRLTLYVFREAGAQAGDSEETSLCEILAGQFLRGLQIARRIGASEVERSLYSTVMERLSVGILILDIQGRIIKCSSRAEEALSARDGIQMQAGRFRATCAKEDRELQAAIKAATQRAQSGEGRETRGLALTKLSGSRSLGIIVQPVPAVRGGGVSTEPTVAIYVRDPEANADVGSDLVRQLFDLTPAEAAVARRLTAGLSLEDVAAALDISRNTARAHLRSIFSKSGITRQTELVRLMLNSAAVLGGPQNRAA